MMTQKPEFAFVLQESEPMFMCRRQHTRSFSSWCTRVN